MAGVNRVFPGQNRTDRGVVRLGGSRRTSAGTAPAVPGWFGRGLSRVAGEVAYWQALGPGLLGREAWRRCSEPLVEHPQVSVPSRRLDLGGIGPGRTGRR